MTSASGCFQLLTDTGFLTQIAAPGESVPGGGTQMAVNVISRVAYAGLAPVMSWSTRIEASGTFKVFIRNVNSMALNGSFILNTPNGQQTLAVGGVNTVVTSAPFQINTGSAFSIFSSMVSFQFQTSAIISVGDRMFVYGIVAAPTITDYVVNSVPFIPGAGESFQWTGTGFQVVVNRLNTAVGVPVPMVIYKNVPWASTFTLTSSNTTLIPSTTTPTPIGNTTPVTINFTPNNALAVGTPVTLTVVVTPTLNNIGIINPWLYRYVDTYWSPPATTLPRYSAISPIPENREYVPTKRRAIEYSSRETQTESKTEKMQTSHSGVAAVDTKPRFTATPYPIILS
jgi:hypothetical protein